MTVPFPPQTPDTPQGDPAGQAIASLRGYAYQLYATGIAWLSLQVGEELYLEVAQDYATAVRDALAAVQVKDTQSTTTLNSEKARQAIADLVDLVERNPGRRVTLRYLSTSSVGKEQKNEHRVGTEPALHYWARAAANQADIAPLRDVLLHLELGDKAREYIAARNDDQLRNELISRISWDCGQPPLDEVKHELERRLALYVKERLKIPEAEAERLLASVVLHLLNKAIEPDAAKRKLTADDLYSLLDNASRVSLPRADIELIIKAGADLARAASTPGAVPARLPAPGQPDIARAALERDFSSRYRRALHRSHFPEAGKADQFKSLANEILDNQLTVISEALRRRILLRAARSAALRSETETAEAYLAAAEQLQGPDSDLSARARIGEARGDAGLAIRILRDADDPESRSTFFNVLARAKGDDAALAWLDERRIDLTSLTAQGVFSICQAHLRKENLPAAKDILEAATNEQLEDCPYLLLLRGALRFACLLPKPDQKLPLIGLQLDVRRVRPILPAATVTDALDSAAQDFQRLIPLVKELDLREAARLAEDYLVWFDLVHPARGEAALHRLRNDMSDPRKALSRIQFAFAYDPTFDPKPVASYLEKREEFGGLNDDELRAAFLIVLHANDPPKVAGFIGKHRARLDTSFGKYGIRLVEVQALARSGDATGAKAALAEITGTIDQVEIARLNAEIATAEGADPVAEYKRAYDANPTPEALRALVATLAQREDYRSIGPYAEKLFELTNDPRDIAYAANAYARSGDNENFFRLVKAHPGVTERDDRLLSHYGWQLFHAGRLREAKLIAEQLQNKPAARDLNLEVAIAIETGEWETLSQPLTAFLQVASTLSGIALIQAAHLSQASGQGPTLDLVAAAVAQGGNDPNVLLGAYTLYVEEGIEDQKQEAHEWFRRALALSGDDGPIQRFELKDILAKQIEWNKRTQFIHEGISRGDIPLAIGASGLRTTLIDVILRNFTRNSAIRDGRRRASIPVFSGRRKPGRVGEVKRLALDLSAVLVLGWLGLLPKVFDAFPEIVLPSGALRELFEGRRRIREFQKSRLQHAERIHRAIALGNLKITRSSTPRSDPLVTEVGEELAGLLRAAQAADGVVLRPAPVHKPGVEQMRDADVSAYFDRLADMHSLLDELKGQGVIDQATETTSKQYFDMQDKGWPSTARPTAARPLYVDGLALVYLDTVHLLDAVLSTFKDVYIDASTEQEATALIEHDRHTNEVLQVIDAIRDTIRKANAKNKIIFAPRRVADQDDADDEGFELSTLNLIANLMGAEAVALDDRSLNKEPFVQDQGRYRAKIVTTLDIIEELHARHAISDDERRTLRHRLRNAGAGLIPVDTEEIVLAALRSKDAESAEMKAIKESVLLARVAELPRFPAEVPWFASAMIAIKNAVTEIWEREPDHARAAELANAVLDLRLNPEDWVSRWEGAPPPNWLETVRIVIIAGIALPVELASDELVKAYNGWLEQHVLGPLRLRSPKSYEALVAYVRNFVDAISKDDDD
jgi:hypothetical protein